MHVKRPVRVADDGRSYLWVDCLGVFSFFSCLIEVSLALFSFIFQSHTWHMASYYHFMVRMTAASQSRHIRYGVMRARGAHG